MICSEIVRKKQFYTVPISWVSSKELKRLLLHQVNQFSYSTMRKWKTLVFDRRFWKPYNLLKTNLLREVVDARKATEKLIVCLRVLTKKITSYWVFLYFMSLPRLPLSLLMNTFFL